MTEEYLDESEVYQIRKKKLETLREEGFNFPNHFRREDLAADLNEQYADVEKEALA